MEFQDLPLNKTLLRGIEEVGYEDATPIQEKAIPQVLKGSDLIGCAQTGTGKTAAFALPTMQRLLDSADATGAGKRRLRSNSKVIRCLILAPTRELAGQIGESFETYGKFTSLRYTVIFGGVGQGNQVRAIDRGVDILVATPGRLLDLIGQGYIDLGKVEILILDEADQMLDMGFIHDLRKIVKRCPRERQTLMFSATMPPEIRKLTREWLNKPFELHVAPVASTPNLVSQSIYFVEKKQKLSALVHFLKETPRSRTLVFSRTKWGADRIAKALNREGIKSTAIHGNKSQNRRQAAIKEFKSEEPPVLVATDIAARGLDFDDISHVINYDLPDTPETYVHRIGRTARAGASGAAVSFCDSDERKLVRGIERLTGCKIAAKNMPQFAELKPASDGGRSRGGGNQNSRSRNGSGARGQGNGERGGNENRGKKKPTKRRRFKAKDRGDSRDDSTRSEESSTQTKPAKKKTKKKVSEQKRTFKKRDNDSNGNDSSQGEGKVTAKKVKKTGTVKSTVKKKSSFKKGGKKHFGNSSGNSPKGNAGDHNTR